MIVNIHGDLAGILHMSQNAKNTENSVNQQVLLVAGGGSPSDLIYVTNQRLSVKNQVQDEVQVLLGAGVGFEPTTFRL